MVIGLASLVGYFIIHKSHAAGADINGDGVINISDLSILAAHFGMLGQTFSTGDLNGDGVVNISDLSILAAAWGQVGSGTGVIPASFFSMDFSNGNPPDEYTTLTVSIGDLGKETAAEWGNIEPTAPTGSGCPGTVNCTHTYNWTRLDSYLTTATAHNLPFQWTWEAAPAWASNNNPTGPVTDNADFDAFVNTLVTRYNGNNGHGLISAYEVNNETDFSGTVAQLAAQTNRFVNDIKAVNPTALIVGIGMAQPDTYYAPGNMFDQFWADWKAINPNAHLDVISYHGYPHTGNPVPETIMGPVSGVPCTSGYAACIKAAITRNGLPASTKIWDTEGSWGCNSASSDCNGSRDNPLLTSAQQVAFVARYLMLTWSAGVSRQNWYSWDEVSWGRLIGTPAATAYQQVENWMVGNTMNQPCTATGTVWTCGFSNSTLAVWNTAGSSSYTPAAGYIHYKDLAGGTTNFTSGSAITIGTQPLLLTH